MMHVARADDPLVARDFMADEALLREVLGDVIRHSDGEGVLELVERTVALARRPRR